MSEKSRILLVDDDQVSGTLLAKKLESRDFCVEFVQDGHSCLKRIEDGDIDIVLLDIMMPGLSGVETLGEIRKKFNNVELPVVMVTSKDAVSDIVDALKRGANDYLVKPVNIDIALARIMTQVTLKNHARTSLALKEVTTINTMVATLSHEINNPLTIALGNLSLPTKEINLDRVSKAKEALERIVEIVKKIKNISSKTLEETSYTDNINTYKLD